MSVETSITFFIAVFIFSITPGPGVFAIVARALTLGARSCFLLTLGMTVSDIFYLVAACFGLAAIATHWSEVFLVIRILGAGYLLYLGWKMWTAPVDFDEEERLVEKQNSYREFIQGFFISASNPKVILFYIAFLPTFMDLSLLNGRDIVLVSVLTLFSLMAGLMSIAYFAAKARVFFDSRSGVAALNKSAGSIMMGAGAFLLFKS